uniref:Beta-xylanase n=1 Tax=Flammulina velutipes TaxID=38945 RepID=G8A553_FLAVE|nr:putative endo-1,4-beta-xylanase precursor [Flammulina velutipes]
MPQAIHLSSYNRSSTPEPYAQKIISVCDDKYSCLVKLRCVDPYNPDAAEEVLTELCLITPRRANNNKTEMASRSIAVLGYGVVGKPLVNDLLAKGARVLVVSRDITKLKDLPLDAGLKTASVDYDNEKQVSQVFKEHAVDVVVSTLTTDITIIKETQVRIGRAAKEAGVQLFLPEEFGFFPDGHPEDSMWGAKSLAASRLKEVGIPTTRIITGVFTEIIPWLASTDSKPGEFVIAGTGERKVSFTSLTDITGYVAHILTALPLASLEDKILLLEGQAATLREVAEILHKDVANLSSFDEITNPFVRNIQKAIDSGYGRTGFAIVNSDAPQEVVDKRSTSGNALWEGHCVDGYACTFFNRWYSQCLRSTTTVTSVPASSTTASVSASAALPTATGTDTPLHAAATAAGKLYFGTATDNGELSDAPYKAILSNTTLFGQITPSNSMKWEVTEPQRGTFDFTGGDRSHHRVAQPAPSMGRSRRVRQRDTDTDYGGPYNHCYIALCWESTHNLRSYAWDVVNEALNEDGTFRESVFYKTIGESYIATAFKAARAADPSAKLYINDYNIDGTGAKSTGIINLVSSLLEQGVPVDGIGIQAHLVVGTVPTTLQENWQAMADLGVDVAITELDIRMTLPVTAARLEQQKADYENVVAACMAVTRCIGITIWDWTDKYSWVPGVFEGEGAPLPWDENLVAKPAYDGIVNALIS